MLNLLLDAGVQCESQNYKFLAEQVGATKMARRLDADMLMKEQKEVPRKLATQARDKTRDWNKDKFDYDVKEDAKV